MIVSPELINQRGVDRSDTKKWDRLFISSYFLLRTIGSPLIMGIDIGLGFFFILNIYFPIFWIIIHVIAMILGTWAIYVNKHFEGLVRIQKDRNHKVIRSGPYKIIRHPGNLSMILGDLGFLFMIGSIMGFIPQIIAIVLVILRTYKEDKTLIKELEGYKEYKKGTKYRLIPKIW